MSTKPPISSGKPGAEPASAAGANPASCPLPSPPDLSGVTVVALHPPERLPDYLQALQLASAEAGARLGEPMLLSWYDRDRDFEAPQHVSECHAAGAVPGYVDYGIHHGATLKVDVEDGRFVFFYRSADL
jgi:Domain of unknown function (DUF5619)